MPDKIDFKTRAITRDKEGPSNFTSGYLSEETQNTNSKKWKHPSVRCGVIDNSWYMEATQVPINRRVDKKVMAHIYIHAYMYTKDSD